MTRRLVYLQSKLFFFSLARHACTHKAYAGTKSTMEGSVLLVCGSCAGILSPVGFASIDRYRKKGQLSSDSSVLSYFRSVSHVWLARSIDGSSYLLFHVLIRCLLIKANTTVPRNNNSVNDHPFISRVAAFAYKHAKLNIHINFLFAVHADKYAQAR